MLIALKSTVPIGTTEKIGEVIAQKKAVGVDFDIAFCPEFLREGSAVYGCMHPYRTIIGANSERAAILLKELHLPFRAPIVITNIRTAEMIKYASNAFLATKISFMNEIARLCDLMGADVSTVAHGMGFDKRIGHLFLQAGLGFGGPCLSKDVKALIAQAKEKGYHPILLKAVFEINAAQPRYTVRKLEEALGDLSGKTIGILGLSFKPGTSDMRDAQSIPLIKELQERGARVKAYDPCANGVAKQLLPRIELVDDEYVVAESDALVIATEWRRFRELDLEKIKDSLRSPVIIDGRNMYDPTEMRTKGFIYKGIGR